MENFRLSTAPVSTKLLVTSLICVIGLTYLLLVVHIWIDTEMKPSLVSEAYGGMEYMELTDHAHNYLPYYALFLFAIPVGIFMFTSYSENLKRFLAVWPFIVIVIDIASMYLIPYLWTGFGLILWIAGTLLGITLFIMTILTMYDVWLRRA